MELKILKFVKNNENWEELLSQDPYNLIITRDNGYIMFKYDQIKSDFSLDIVKEARGIIFREKDFKVVCFPFIKFFNVEEPYADDINWENIQVQEKVDGSLIKVWADTSENGLPIWNISTNGTIDAFKANLTENMSDYHNFGELFMSVFDADLLFNLNKDYTYMFELVSPYNKVVVPYDKIDIYHIGTRNNITGEELNVDIGVKKPKVYNLNSKNEIKEAAEKLPFNEEGYVVVDDNFKRVKIKSPAYVNAHHLVNNKMINLEKMLNLIIENEQDEFLAYFPEYTEDFKKLSKLYNKYKEYLQEIENEVNRLKQTVETKKDFAQVLKSEFPMDTAVGFMLYDKKVKNWNEWLKQQTNAKIIERIKKI